MYSDWIVLTALQSKFMVGTQQGNVLACNRKLRSAERIGTVYEAHYGAVSALQR